jgi:hypothetical protein
MFELIIFCVIALAIGYWTTLFLMGRREDVLHGDFVEGKERPERAATQPSTAQLPAMQTSAMQAPKMQAPKVRPASAERLQSLLTAIKQDLKDAAQI